VANLTVHSPNTEFSARSIQKTDAQLVRACRRGDESAWNELVDRFQRLIFAIPRRAGLNDEQASDVFQEVFTTLLEKIDDIEEPEKIRSWIVTTAKFKTWAVVRSEKGMRNSATTEEMEFEMESLVDRSPLPDALLVELEEQHLIRTALKDLDERCRTIISMIYLKEQAASYAAVAKEIGVGETSISPLRSRCLRKLAAILKK
jgi:RNA polymerase sigma factor (sigma-70 family)